MDKCVRQEIYNLKKISSVCVFQAWLYCSSKCCTLYCHWHSFSREYRYFTSVAKLRNVQGIGSEVSHGIIWLIIGLKLSPTCAHHMSVVGRNWRSLAHRLLWYYIGPASTSALQCEARNCAMCMVATETNRLQSDVFGVTS